MYKTFFNYYICKFERFSKSVNDDKFVFRVFKFERNYSKHTIIAYKKDINSFYEFCINEFEIESLVEVNYSQIRSWIV